MYIAEKQRGAGLGSKIVQYIAEQMKVCGATEIRLHCSVRNTTGLRFWIKEGFDRIVLVQCDGNFLPGTFAGVELRRDL